jgi:hypothetical protein
MKAEIRQSTLIIEDLRLPVEEAKSFLKATYPALLDAFVVKSTLKVKNSKRLFGTPISIEARYVDWQGCLLHPLTKIILYVNFKGKP